MNLCLLIFAGLAAFFCGFTAGLLQKNGAERKSKPQRPSLPKEDLERLRAEYRNFLDYDGTEQN